MFTEPVVADKIRIPDTSVGIEADEATSFWSGRTFVVIVAVVFVVAIVWVVGLFLSVSGNHLPEWMNWMYK